MHSIEKVIELKIYRVPEFLFLRAYNNVFGLKLSYHRFFVFSYRKTCSHDFLWKNLDFNFRTFIFAAMKTMSSVKATETSTGSVRIFRSMNEAADRIGVTEGAVRSAIRKGRSCRGWSFELIPSVFVVRMKDDGNYYVCERSEGGGGFDMLGSDGGYLQDRDVAEFWDVTENFNRVRDGKEEKSH